MDATQIIRALGGPSKLAATLGVPGNTVAYWGHRNKIPADRWLDMWRLALAAGLPWQPPGAEGLRDLLCPGAAVPGVAEVLTDEGLASYHNGYSAEVAQADALLAQLHGDSEAA